MKKNIITTIATRLNVTHGAVSQWFSGDTVPRYPNMLILNKEFNVPFEAWEDIKSFDFKSISDSKTNK